MMSPIGGPGGVFQTFPRYAQAEVPPALRRALVERDRHCVWPGCFAQASRCDPYNVANPAEARAARLGDLALVCDVHQLKLGEGRLRLTRNPDGTWTAS